MRTDVRCLFLMRRQVQFQDLFSAALLEVVVVSIKSSECCF